MSSSFPISSIPPGGLPNIVASGYYYLENDIAWEAASGSSTAIILGSSSAGVSNVVIDLKGFTLQQTNQSIAASNKLINIHAGASNIIIKNGTFSGGAAVLAGEGSASSPIVTLSIIDVNILNAGGTSSADGLNLAYCNGLIIDNVSINGLTNMGTGNAFAFFLSNCSNVTVKNSQASNVNGITTTIGYFLLGTTNFTIDNCSATNIAGSCADCHGFAIFEGSNNGTLTNCFASQISSNLSGTQAYVEKATGFEIFGVNDVTLKNCATSDILAVNPGRHHAGGFTNAAGNNITFDSCTSTNVQCIENDLYPLGLEKGFGVGFGNAPDPRVTLDTNGNPIPALNTVWKNCVSNGNSASTPQNGIGFQLFGQVNALLINSSASGNSGYGVYNNGAMDQGPSADFTCTTTPVVTIVDNSSNNYVVQNNTFVGNGFGGAFDKSGANALYKKNVCFPKQCRSKKN